jgi:hypothetical protein
MIFIARNGQGFIVSIIKAKSKELANAYWQGCGTDAFSIECLETDRIPFDEHPTGVMPILETMKKSLSKFASFPEDYIVVKK